MRLPSSIPAPHRRPRPGRAPLLRRDRRRAAGQVARLPPRPPRPAAAAHEPAARQVPRRPRGSNAAARTPDETADLGALLVRLGEPRKAVDLLRPAARANPDHFRLAANLGTAWQLAGDLEQAAVALEDAVRLAPPGLRDAEKAHLKLVRLRQKEGKAAVTAVDDLFGVRYVGAGGKPAAGTLAAAERDEAPGRRRGHAPAARPLAPGRRPAALAAGRAGQRQRRRAHGRGHPGRLRERVRDGCARPPRPPHALPRRRGRAGEAAQPRRPPRKRNREVRPGLGPHLRRIAAAAGPHRRGQPDPLGRPGSNDARQERQAHLLEARQRPGRQDGHAHGLHAAAAGRAGADGRSCWWNTRSAAGSARARP